MGKWLTGAIGVGAIALAWFYWWQNGDGSNTDGPGQSAVVEQPSGRIVAGNEATSQAGATDGSVTIVDSQGTEAEASAQSGGTQSASAEGSAGEGTTGDAQTATDTSSAGATTTSEGTGQTASVTDSEGTSETPAAAVVQGNTGTEVTGQTSASSESTVAQGTDASAASGTADTADSASEATAGSSTEGGSGATATTEGSTEVAALSPASEAGDATQSSSATNTGAATESAAPSVEPVAAPQPEPIGDPGAPRFDVVRVDQDGQMVVAGTAEPGQEVEILLDGKVVGKAEADANGGFVAVLFADLSGDAQQIQLRVPSPADSQTVPASAQQSTSLAGSASSGTTESAQAESDPQQTDVPSSAASGTQPAGAQTDTQAELAQADAAQDGSDSASRGVDLTGAGNAGTTGETQSGSDASATTAQAASTETASAGQAASTASTEQVGAESTAEAEPASAVAAAETDAAAPSAPSVDTATQPTASAPASDTQPVAESGDNSPTRLALADQPLSQPAAPSAPSVDSANEPRFALSAPVIILPSTGDEKAAPTLVQPDAEGLTLLQPGGGRVEGVVLDRITYGESGEVRFAGRGTPGRFVRIYGNAQPLDLTQVDSEGAWRWSMARAAAQQIKLFRFDQLDPGGNVASRIETPFEYSSLSPQVLRQRKVVIQRGDMLWRIAEQFYGEGIRYSMIYGANSALIRDPDLIYPGQVFTIPELVDAN